MDQNIAQQKIKDLSSEVEKKVQQINVIILELLSSLENQEKVDWLDIVQKYSVLSQMFTSLQQILRKSGNDLDDNLKRMKMTQLVPQVVSQEFDSNLQVSNLRF
jgi:hypothetical protein